jgi:hypothetical protein
MAPSQSQYDSGPSSALSNQTQDQIRNKEESQSQSVLDGYENRKIHKVPTPDPIADFVLKFYRYFIVCL